MLGPQGSKQDCHLRKGSTFSDVQKTPDSVGMEPRKGMAVVGRG